MSESDDDILSTPEMIPMPVGGTNFLVSAVMLLRKQKWDMQRELFRLRERVQILEAQNAAFLNVSADRLLQKRG